MCFERGRMLTGNIQALYHYPVKGLTAQRIDHVRLNPAQGFPFDREFGFARHDSGYDPNAYKPLPKTRFLMLMMDERLAGLESHFDTEIWQLSLHVQGKPLMAADLSTQKGRQETETFFARMFDMTADEMPRFVHAAPHRFTDVSVASEALMNAVSLINTNSVKAFGQKIGQEIDPMRFRGNILFDGWPPFSELDLVGKEIRIGDARAKITLRTRRCAATEVNPKTVKRDLPLPRLLVQHYGHADMGVYAEIETGAEIEPGAPIRCEGV